MSANELWQCCFSSFYLSPSLSLLGNSGSTQTCAVARANNCEITVHDCTVQNSETFPSACRGIKARMNHSSTLIHSNLCSVRLKSFFWGASRCLYQSCTDSGWIWFNCCDLDLIGASLSFQLIFSPAIAFQLITSSEALLANKKCIWLPCHSSSRKSSMVVNVLVSKKKTVLCPSNLHTCLIYSSILQQGRKLNITAYKKLILNHFLFSLKYIYFLLCLMLMRSIFLVNRNHSQNIG